MKAELDFREIGSRIQKYRTEKHMTQEELSEHIGTSQKYVSRIEMGYHNIKLETISAIANALSVSIDLLVYGYDTDSDAIFKVILSELQGMTPKQLEMLRENINTIKKFKLIQKPPISSEIDGFIHGIKTPNKTSISYISDVCKEKFFTNLHFLPF